MSCALAVNEKSPLAGYYGGKGHLAPLIAAIVDSEEHKLYAEPFCGGASVFFACHKRENRLYILNDKDSRITNFWRVGKTQPEALFHVADEFGLDSDEFYDISRSIYRHPKPDEDDTLAAWAVWYQSRRSFSGSLGSGRKRTTGNSKSQARSHAFNLAKLKKQLGVLSLASVENMDAAAFILQYDKPDSFFYIDPPYVGADQGPYSGYSRDDFRDLLKTLETCEGKFILSHRPQSDLDEFADRRGWHKTTINTVARAAFGDKPPMTELLVMNFKPSVGLGV